MALGRSKRLKTEILAILKNHSEGLSRKDIGKALVEKVPERTLQRWLEDLVREQKVTTDGETRATKYTVSEEQDQAEKEEGEGIVFSEAARKELKSVDRPTRDRAVVGYEAEMLLEYLPNQTWYLSESEREALWEVGHVFQGEYPAGTYAQQLYDRLIVDLSWASSNLEGNTYSLLDTRILLEQGHQALGKDALETQMILNHKEAIDLMVSGEPYLGFNRPTILNLHASLSHGLLPDPEDEGKLRLRPVRIGGSNFVPLAIPQKIEEYFDLILEKTTAIEDPFEQAFFFFVHIPYLQPFSDVNKRVARMGSNLSLIKANLCPLSFIGVPREDLLMSVLSFYESRNTIALKEVFLWAYKRSAERYTVVRDSLPKPDPLRLKYRFMLSEALQDVVRGGLPIKRDSVSAIIPQTVVKDEQEAFLGLLLEELLNMHEGNIMRHRIRPSEFEAWQEKIGSAK